MTDYDHPKRLTSAQKLIDSGITAAERVVQRPTRGCDCNYCKRTRILAREVELKGIFIKEEMRHVEGFGFVLWNGESELEDANGSVVVFDSHVSTNLWRRKNSIEKYDIHMGELPAGDGWERTIGLTGMLKAPLTRPIICFGVEGSECGRWCDAILNKMRARVAMGDPADPMMLLSQRLEDSVTLAFTEIGGNRAENMMRINR